EAQPFAAPGDALHPKHAIPYRTQGEAARPGEAGGDRSPQCGIAVEVRRLARQQLPVLSQHLLQLAERRAGPCGQHQLSRLVRYDAAMCGQVEPLGRIGSRDVEAFAAAAAKIERLPGLGSGLDALLQLGAAVFALHSHQKRSNSGNGSCPRCTCMAPNSAQRLRVGMALPGLSSPSGSKAALIAKNCSSSALLNCTHIWLIFSTPTPCSPLMVPPTSMHSSRILPPSSSVRSSSPGLLPS